MSLKKLFLAFVVSMFAFCVNVEAEILTTLTAEDHGVLGAMHDVGCNNPQWLGRVMMDSGILESQLNRLPVGTSIKVPEACLSEAPAREDIKITRGIFSAQSMSQNLQNLQTQLAQVKEQLQKAWDDITERDRTISGLKKQLADQRAPVATQPISAKAQQISILRWRLAFGITFLVCLFALGGFALLFSEELPVRKELKLSKDNYEKLKSINQGLSQNYEQLTLEHQQLIGRHGDLVKRYDAGPARPYPTEIMFHGKVIRFRDVTVPTLACLDCSENSIKAHEQNMRQHVIKHTHIRVKKISPEEASQLLSMASAKA